MNENKLESRIVVEDFFKAMGTNISWKIIFREIKTEIEIEEIKNKIRNIFKESEKIFSRFREDSELSKINKLSGKRIKVSAEMLEILLLCKKFNQISKGYFDPRIIKNLEKIGYDKNFNKSKFIDGKSFKLEKIEGKFEDDLEIFEKEREIICKKEIDTTGIVKGWTVDRTADFLLSEGINNFVIDAGGDMNVRGMNEKGEKWKIEIEGIDINKVLLKVSNLGIATSGINRRQWKIGNQPVHHLINPKKLGEFSFDLVTVTIIENKTVEADGRAKSLFLMGKEKGLEFVNKNKIKALFLDKKSNVYFSKTIKKHFA